MSVAEISHAIQEIGFLVAVRESAILYPVIMASHLACIALFGGMILVTDLRLVGLSMTKIPVVDLLNGMRIWKRIGLFIMLLCGVLLATSEMDKYYANPYFHLKLLLLVFAALHPLFFKDVYTRAAEIDKSTALQSRAKLAGWTSMVIWIGIICCGRWIAYYEPPERKPGGALNPIGQIEHVQTGVENARLQFPATVVPRQN